MSYKHLTRKERRKIGNLQKLNKGIREISRIMGRSASTISREIKRNSENGKYKSTVASQRYNERRARCKPKGRISNEELVKYVKEKLNYTWSPEQIANRLPLDYPEDQQFRVSHSTIYRWLHEGEISQAAALRLKLRHYGHHHGESRGKFNGVRELKERSKAALKRKRIGDWEVDTIVSSDRSHQECLLSMCDRKSRYCGLVLLHRRNSSEVMRGFRFFFSTGKIELKTITADRGTEFACYSEVENEWNVPFYFTRPRSPWQKGSVENLNGLVRQFFPKGTNFNEIEPESVIRVMDILNNRPRKVLGWRTPTEVFNNCCT